MTTTSKTVYGTLFYKGKQFLSLSPTPIKLADEQGNPIEISGIAFLVTGITPKTECVKHPCHQSKVWPYEKPSVLIIGEEEPYCFVFETLPHEIVCEGNGSEEEEVDCY